MPLTFKSICFLLAYYCCCHYRTSAYSFHGNYSFLKVENVDYGNFLLHELNSCRGNYLREETIRGNRIFNLKLQNVFDPIVLRNHTSNQKTRTQSIHDAPQKNQHKNKTIFPTIHTKKLVTKGESVILPLFWLTLRQSKNGDTIGWKKNWTNIPFILCFDEKLTLKKYFLVRNTIYVFSYE